jgi:hypothetical protein
VLSVNLQQCITEVVDGNKQLKREYKVKTMFSNNDGYLFLDQSDWMTQNWLTTQFMLQFLVFLYARMKFLRSRVLEIDLAQDGQLVCELEAEELHHLAIVLS